MVFSEILGSETPMPVDEVLDKRRMDQPLRSTSIGCLKSPSSDVLNQLLMGQTVCFNSLVWGNFPKNSLSDPRSAV